MNSIDLLKYAEPFRAIRTHYTHEHNQSPHKFILLLSVFAYTIQAA